MKEIKKFGLHLKLDKNKLVPLSDCHYGMFLIDDDNEIIVGIKTTVRDQYGNHSCYNINGEPLTSYFYNKIGDKLYGKDAYKDIMVFPFKSSYTLNTFISKSIK